MTKATDTTVTASGELNVEQAVKQRYAAASQAAESALCCPVDYNPDFLRVLPDELIERDYGCGDPSRYVREGETVLDLGSGGGKICYIASQIVGPEGKVIGVDMNDSMLHLARKYQEQVSENIGWNNVTFHKGKIQDLALDLDRFESHLRDQPIEDLNAWESATEYANVLRATEPMVADNSVDVVVSNCVLNLVSEKDRQQLFAEIFRVLRRGGRAVISDIVCDEAVPAHLKEDPELWSGCISGAYREDQFLEAFAAAGFYGMEIFNRQSEAWATVEGIEFRSLTVQAKKGKEGPCDDHHQAVIYKGPWKSVTDDDGHVLRRGERMAVCEKTYHIYCSEPYANSIIPLPPTRPVSAADAKPFDCRTGMTRDPGVTKSEARDTILPVNDCCGGGSC